MRRTLSLTSPRQQHANATFKCEEGPGNNGLPGTYYTDGFAAQKRCLCDSCERTMWVKLFWNCAKHIFFCAQRRKLFESESETQSPRSSRPRCYAAARELGDAELRKKGSNSRTVTQCNFGPAPKHDPTCVAAPLWPRSKIPDWLPRSQSWPRSHAWQCHVNAATHDNVMWMIGVCTCSITGCSWVLMLCVGPEEQDKGT